MADDDFKWIDECESCKQIWYLNCSNRSFGVLSSIGLYLTFLMLSCGSPKGSDISYTVDCPPLRSISRLAVLTGGPDNGCMAVLDLEQGRQVGTFVFDFPIYRLAIRHLDNSVWFTSDVSKQGLYRIDPNTNQLHRVNIPYFTGGLIFSNDSRTLYISGTNLYIVDPDRPEQFQRVFAVRDEKTDWSILDFGISLSGQVATTGCPVSYKKESIGRNVSFHNAQTTLLFLDMQNLSLHPGGRVGAFSTRPLFSRDGNLIVTLSYMEGSVAIYDVRTQNTEKILTESASRRLLDLGGFNPYIDRLYVLVNYPIRGNLYRDTTYVAVIDIRTKKILDMNELPGTFLRGIYDSQTSYLYLVGPHSPKLDLAKNPVPVEKVTLYDPETNRVLRTISIDRRVGVGAKLHF